MSFRFLFETAHDGNYVGVLSTSRLVQGRIASQDAGSSNPGMYYQVDGGGVNGLFAVALGETLRTEINRRLVAAYEDRFAAAVAKAWQSDQTSNTLRLTSFYVALPDDAHDTGAKVGRDVAGLIYSVGPQLPGSADTFPDPDLYRQIYVDAFAELARANAAGAKINAFRLTMISTGIYGGPGLAGQAATLILDALERAAKSKDAAHLPTTLLVNNSSVARTQPNKELNAFTGAAEARGIDVTSDGFTFDPA